MKRTKPFSLFVFLLLIGCSQPAKENKANNDLGKPVLISLLNVSFYEPQWTIQQKAKLDSNLNAAKQNFDKEQSEENFIWYARRLGYLSRFDSAIIVLTEGIQKFPESYRLYRHRGHRFISLRKFDNAISDLETAGQLMEGKPMEIEPDGQPNKINQPLSSTQFNVWYHLGLAYYLKADFTKAEEVYLKCLAVSNNDDLITATVDWLYMTYRREGKMAEATKLLDLIHDKMTIIENDSYMNRLKMYKGSLAPEQVLNPDPKSEDYDLSLATQGYGVGNWYLYNGDKTKAKSTFEQIVARKHFSSFGFIAAEVELVKLR
jgi:tetratricopeptide (TPR) repeat protein